MHWVFGFVVCEVVSLEKVSVAKWSVIWKYPQASGFVYLLGNDNWHRVQRWGLTFVSGSVLLVMESRVVSGNGELKAACNTYD